MSEALTSSLLTCHWVFLLDPADGYEYVGQWKDDEMNGEFMNNFVYGMKEDKVPNVIVQIA